MDDNEFVKRFSNLHEIYLKRFHSRLDSAMVAMNNPAIQNELDYWRGWNAGLEWAHRIIRGDKSAD